jgi:AraC-like DNA-binding protein
MNRSEQIGLDRKTFDHLARVYRRRWKISLQAARPDGTLLFGRKDSCPDHARRQAIREALRWGEATVSLCPPQKLIWAVPLMHNAHLLGGLVAVTPEKRVFPDQSGATSMNIRDACADLRGLAEEANLTNAALLAANRTHYRREQERAHMLHEIKLSPYANVRQMYLRDEPALVAAIREDDRAVARAILNRVLAAIYHQAGSRIDLIKSFFMELVVTMCRTAVEAGGESEQLYGTNFASLSQLANINSEEELAPWLHEMLERIMDSIRRHRRQTHPVQISEALQFISEHYQENISRDDVARAVHISPSHLSRMIMAHVGRSYTDLLSQMRVDRAKQLLARTDKPLVLIAFETGFKDQSYFTKVFRRYTRKTPRQYREEKMAD